jgi:hypothetical protein
MIFDVTQMDVTLYQMLEDELFKVGLWVDMDSFQPNYNTTDINTAKQAIRDSGKNPVEVKLDGSPREKLNILDSMITIRRNFFTDGAVGSGNPIQFTQTNPGEVDPLLKRWNKVANQSLTVNVEYEFRYITNTESNHYEIDLVMMNAFGAMKGVYLRDKVTRVASASDYFELRMNGVPNEIKSLDWIERQYRYIATNVTIANDVPITQNVVPIGQVGLIVTADSEDAV